MTQKQKGFWVNLQENWQIWHTEIIWNFMFMFLTQNHPNLLEYEETQPPHKALCFGMKRFPNRDITIGISEFTLTYFVLWPTNAQLFHKLSHSHMFRHYRVILRQLVISTLPSYTSISNAAVCNTIYNFK